MKLAAAKLYAVFCLLPGERVSIKDDVCRRVAAQEITRLQLANEHSKIFYREAGLFANFSQMRRPAETCKKLKNHSPHAVLLWLKGLIPFLGETQSRAIAPEERLSRSGPGHHGPVRAVNAGSYLRGHARLFPV